MERGVEVALAAATALFSLPETKKKEEGKWRGRRAVGVLWYRRVGVSIGGKAK